MDPAEKRKDKSEQPIAPDRSQEISPITNLPLMIDNVFTIDEGKNTKKPVLGPIVQPTARIWIYGRKQLINSGKEQCICLRCTKEDPCPFCVCHYLVNDPVSLEQLPRVDSRAEHVLQSYIDTYIDASKKKDVKTHLIDGIYLCSKCALEKIEIYPYTGQECVVKFSTISQAVRFYLVHKPLLLCKWVPGAAFSVDKPQHSGRSVEIMEKAFSLSLSVQRHYVYLSDDALFQRPERAEKTAPSTFFSETDRANNFVYLASGKYSNITLQSKLCNLTQQELLETLQGISPHSFFFLSKHKYGTYVIQIIIKIAECGKVIQEIKKLMLPHASALLQDSIGNYVVQKMLSYDTRFVLNCFLSDFEVILRNKIGCRAFKNCTKNFLVYHREILPRLQGIIAEDIPQEELKILKTAAKELVSASVSMSVSTSMSAYK